jgi:hypothetical protein
VVVAGLSTLSQNWATHAAVTLRGCYAQHSSYAHLSGSYWIAVCVVAPYLRAQQTPKKERFGKSLERLKWDEQRKTAIEKKSENQPNTEAAEITLRVETVLTVFDLLVVDKQGQLIKGLGKDDFEIEEDGIPQQVSTFALGDGGSVPRSIVLVVDYSSSQVPYLDRCLLAAQRLIDQINPKDRMAIVTDDIALLVPFTQTKTSSSLAWFGFKAGFIHKV